MIGRALSRALASRRPAPGSALALGVLACVAVVFALSATQAVAAECPNEQLRNESNINPSTGRPYSQMLPDCRAYEMVSPLEKQSHGAKFSTEDEGLLVAPDGDAGGFASEGDFSNPENYSVKITPYNPYLSRRGASGWITSSAFPPANLISYPSLSGLRGDFSPDLNSMQASCGAITLGKGDGEPGGGDGEAIVCAQRREPGGQWVATPRYLTTSGLSLNSKYLYLGGSSDLSRVFIQVGEQLLPSDIAKSGTYEVSGLGTAAPHLRLVNVDNSGSELTTSEQATRLGGALLGDSGNAEGGSAYHAISQSGETVFITATPTGEQSPKGEQQTVYARIHCVVESETCKEDNEELLETVALSNPEPSECTWKVSPTTKMELETLRHEKEKLEEEGKTTEAEAREHEAEAREHQLEAEEHLEEGCHRPRSAAFQGASADGSKVFFTTEQRLLNSDTDDTSDLYEYDFNKPVGHNLIQISGGVTSGEDKDPTPGAGAEVQGVVRTSSDGSHVYFVARGVLTEEANARGEKAQKGSENLYGYDTEAGEGETNLKFVTINGGGDAGGDAVSTDETRHAQTTPNGNFLVFATTPSTELRKGTSEGGALAVYRYDFETGELTWVSHGAKGVRDTKEQCEEEANGKHEPKSKTEKEGCGSSAFVAPVPGTRIGAEADISDWSRAISENGEYIIFTTREKLQAGDESRGALELYEWHAGEVGMISDGHDTAGVNVGVGVDVSQHESESVAGMSASGSDIFFLTHTQLVGQDTDVLVDVYDARENRRLASGEVELAGFPRPPEPVACSGEGCQEALARSSEFGAAASSVSPAGGNLGAPAGGVIGFQTSRPKPLTRAQQLAKALKACKGKPRKKRVACESQAKRTYGAAKAKPNKRKGK